MSGIQQGRHYRLTTAPPGGTLLAHLGAVPAIAGSLVVMLLLGLLTVTNALTAALPANAAVSAVCSLAQNGSFEEPNIQDPENRVAGDAYINGYNMFRTSQATMSGWSTIAGTVDILRYYNNASDGDQSIDLWGTAPATMEQTFTGLVPGSQYTFSIDYSGLQAGASRGSVLLNQGAGFTSLASLSPSVDGISNDTNSVPQTRAYTVTWSTYTHTFTATGTSATIRLQNQTAPATQNTGLFIDNFRFGSDSPCQDFGDAPDSYGTTLASDGARHVVAGYNAATETAPVMLGSTVDTENDGQPSAAADGDGADEDGITGPLVITRNQASTVSVSATNDSNADVTLAGWIDLNGDGAFQITERVTATVPANSGTASYQLAFPAGTTATNTYARFRVYSETVADPQPTGSAVGGEVEDYPVTVQNTTLSVAKTSDATTDTRLGDTITYTVTATNTGTGDYSAGTPATMTDDLSGVLDDGAFNNDAEVSFSAGSTSAQPALTGTNLAWSGPLKAGENATITYSVTLQAGGDGVVRNSACVPAATEPMCAITETRLPAKFLIEKLGESSDSTWVPMAGSSWAVHDDAAGAPGAVNPAYQVSAIPGETGRFQVEGIEPGVYWLEETAAPDGFNLLAEPVQFTVAADGAVTVGGGAGGGVVTAGDEDGDGIFLVTVRDVPALQMPESGGTGSWPYALAGSALLLAAFVLASGNIRRRRNQPAA